MDILKIIITALIGSIIGAWINNTFTLRIKNKVETLYLLYNDINQIHTIFLEFCSVESLRDKQNMYQKGKDTKVLLAPIRENIKSRLFIVDQNHYSSSDMSKLIHEYLNFIDNLIRESNTNTLNHICMIETYTNIGIDLERGAIKYEELLHDILDSISTNIGKITSLPYMDQAIKLIIKKIKPMQLDKKS